MKKENKTMADYLDIDNKIVNIILAIIPITAWILGIITRFKEGAWIAGIIRIIPFLGLVIWILDLVFMIKDGTIFRLDALNAK